MQRAMTMKVLSVGFLFFVLMIPLLMIDDLAGDRKHSRREAIRSVSESTVGAQALRGILLRIPDAGGRYKNYLPDTLNIEGHLDSHELSRGIYKIPGYRATINLVANFDITREPVSFTARDASDLARKPLVTILVKDPRGITGMPTIAINEQTTKMEAGSTFSNLGNGLHSNLPFDSGNIPANIAVRFSIDLTGITGLSISPAGHETTMALTSDWPHPAFKGHFLPQDREITREGFSATWQTSFLANNYNQHIAQCLVEDTKQQKCQHWYGLGAGVDLSDGVDTYLKLERAVKYAFLFIGLTFFAFFLYEHIKKLPIHPVQYALIGAAIAIFFLLVVSLSEHLDFALAYLIAAIACLGLISYYLYFVLKSARHSFAFTALLGSMYGALYVILLSEDYALLAGSGLLFLLLTGAVIYSRRVDWYKMGDIVQTTGPQPKTAPLTHNTPQRSDNA